MHVSDGYLQAGITHAHTLQTHTTGASFQQSIVHPSQRSPEAYTLNAFM